MATSRTDVLAPEQPLRGTPVVAGTVTGPVLRVQPDIDPAAIARFNDGGFADSDAALAAYDIAVAAVSARFAARADAAAGDAANVLRASAGLARDPGLRSAVAEGVTGGAGLLSALDAAVQQFSAMLSGLGGLMAERVTDLVDIRKRIVSELVGEPEPGVPTPEVPSVVVAEDLAPSDTSTLDPGRVVALVIERGGPTSHTAIIARQLGIVCIVGVTGATSLVDGDQVLVDGGAGTVEAVVDAAAAAHRVADSAAREARIAAWAGPARTADQVDVALLANIGDAASAVEAAHEPVTGVGLFRTELCFLNRDVEPTPDEQASIYAAALTPFVGRGHVVVRTLDAGSDKPIAFATHDGEENPALGVRGLRLSFDNPGLMERQLDGIAAAATTTGCDVWAMAPMVATVAEAADFAALVRDRGLKPGVMVEIPSAALLADRLLEVVDFLSIGTNDMTQYAMAADRMATDLAHLTDPWQPAVLQLIAMTAAAGRRAGKPVGVCGEAAADPRLAVALIGMGVTSLSMASRAVRGVGVQIGDVSLSTCEAAAEAALAAPDPATARAAVTDLLHTDLLH